MPRPSARALFLSLAAACVLVSTIQLALGPGITADEIVQRAYGDLILAFYRSHFADERALSYINLYLYGGLFELPVQWIVGTGVLPWPVYESRHVLTALTGLLGVVATGQTARCIRGSRAGLLAALLVLLTPAWVGHSLFNPKDIPFGAAAAFVMYASARIALRELPLRWRDAVLTALALGVALGVRPGGMFLIAYPAAASCLRFVLERERKLRALGVALLRLACTLPLSWLVMLSAWPWAQKAPISRPFQAAAAAAAFDVSGKTRFDGEIVSFSQMPASYLPTWFRVTLPDIYWLAALCGLVVLTRAFRRRQRQPPGRLTATLVVCAFVSVPLFSVMITRPTLYDGHRHFLFLIPGMAVLAGLAFDHVLGSELPAAVRGGVGLLALLLAGVTVYDMAQLHPYEYVYFNRISGGLATQASRFETDYWGASYREGFAWVVENYDAGGSRRIKVRTCAADKVLGYYRKQWEAERFVIGASGTPELYLSITKRDCHKRLGDGEVLHTVERQGAPLLYVMRPASYTAPRGAR